MVLIFEISKPAIANTPVVGNSETEWSIVWMWFAVRWLKIPYHVFAMTAMDWQGHDGERLTSINEVENHFRITRGGE